MYLNIKLKIGNRFTSLELIKTTVLLKHYSLLLQLVSFITSEVYHPSNNLIFLYWHHWRFYTVAVGCGDIHTTHDPDGILSSSKTKFFASSTKKPLRHKCDYSKTLSSSACYNSKHFKNRQTYFLIKWGTASSNIYTQHV